jgi:hypothetical protein
VGCWESKIRCFELHLRFLARENEDRIHDFCANFGDFRIQVLADKSQQGHNGKVDVVLI